MVLEYRKRGSGLRWRVYHNKDQVHGNVTNYEFRLWTHDRTRLLVPPGPYDVVMRRFGQIEYFKHRR